MFFGLDGVELGLIIVFVCLFGGIMSGFPVAFAIGGAATISFGILAMLDSSGFLFKEVMDTSSDAYANLLNSGVDRKAISIFKYPDLPVTMEPLLIGGWETAMNRNISFIANRMNERVIAGQSIETLLAVAMFVLMGIMLERSKIAEDLLTTMGRVFGPLPGGLAVSVVVVGAFLAASTGIVGATVVTMGLLTLPTMLRHNYSPELATGVIAASGTLGQIIPPSIVIVLLGTLAGDIYSAAQEGRAIEAGCTDALTYLGQAAVLSVGTLFKAALLPGIMLAFLYAAYAFGYALLNPSKAPPIHVEASTGPTTTRNHKLLWLMGVPVGVILFAIAASLFNVAGSQNTYVSSVAEQGRQAELRTNVGEQCQASMIELHGQEVWARSISLQAEIEAAGGGLSQEERRRTPEQIEEVRAEMVANAAPVGTGLIQIMVIFGLMLTTAYGVAPREDKRPLYIGGVGISMALLADILILGPQSSPGMVFLVQAIPFAVAFVGLKVAAKRLASNDVLRVVFPPLVLILAVLGSILGGITNPTPAAALGASG
ncbi:MAG: TRAP transporter large permease subunit, partial [Paracoccaceae bacterium]